MLELPTAALAQTAAGTVILNQAVATFALDGILHRVDSNVVRTIVLPRFGLTITPNGSVASPGQTSRGRPGFPSLAAYVLTNTGNKADSFELQSLQVQGPPGRTGFNPTRVQAYLDENINGIIDGIDAPVARLTNIQPGQEVPLLVQVDIPQLAAPDAAAYVTISGASVADPTQRDVDNVAEVLATEDAIVTAVKTASPSTVVAGSKVRYTITGGNIGSAPAKMMDLTIDGVVERGVLIRDTIPDRHLGVRLIVDSIDYAPSATSAILACSTDNQANWTRIRPATGEAVTDLALLVTEGLRPDQSYRLAFSVQTAIDQPAGRMSNVATLSYRNVHEVIIEVRTPPVSTPVTPHPALVFGPAGAPEAGTPEDPARNNEDLQEIRASLTGQVLTITNTMLNNGDVRLDLVLVYLNPPQPGDADSHRLPFGSTVEFFGPDGVTPLLPSSLAPGLTAGSVNPGDTLNIVSRVHLPPGYTPPPNASFDIGLRLQAGASSRVANLTTNRIVNVQNAVAVANTIRKDVVPQGIVPPGAPLQYSISFESASGTTQTNVLVADTLPRELTNVRGFEVSSLTGASGGPLALQTRYDPSTRVVQWSFPTMPAGFRGSLSVTADVASNTPANTSIVNQASISSLEAPRAVVSAAVVNGVLKPNLLLTKEASSPVVALGELTGYRLIVSNQDGAIPLSGVTIEDTLPRGFRLRPGSVTVDGRPAADPAVSGGGRQLRFSLGNLPEVAAPGAAVRTIVYQAIVGADTLQGDAVNTAIAQALTPPPTSMPVQSMTASARVRVRNTRFSTRGTIVGRVYHDNNLDGRFGAGDLGARGVKIYLEDGSFAVTDLEGKYHLEGVREGFRQVKVDTHTLPAGGRLLPGTRPAHGRSGDLVWERMGPSDLMKANFRLEPAAKSGKAAPPIATPAALPPAASSTVTPAERFDSSWFPLGGLTLIVGKLERKSVGGGTVLELTPPVPLALSDAFLLLGPREQGQTFSGSLALEGRALGQGCPNGGGRLFGLSDALAAQPASVLRFELTGKAAPELQPVLLGKNLSGKPVVLVTPESLPAAGFFLENSGCAMENGFWTKRASTGMERPGPGGPIPMPALGTLAGPVLTATAVSAPPLQPLPGIPLQAITSSPPTTALAMAVSGGGEAESRAVAPRPAITPTVHASTPSSPLTFLEPADGARFSGRDAIGITVQFPGQAGIQFESNGQPIGMDHVGTKTFEPSAGLSRFTYLNVKLTPGANRLRATCPGPGGGSLTAERTVFYALAPTKLVLAPASESFAADGRDEAKVRIRALDENGVPAHDGTLLTVTVDEGQLLDVDAAPQLDGLQVRVQGGEATCRLSPSTHSGERLVRASLDELWSECRVRYLPRAGDDFLILRGDLTFGRNRVSGSRRAFSRSNSGRDRFVEGDAALYLRRQVFDDKLLTLSYASDRDREQGKLFRAFDLDEFYPTYGDSSSQQYDAETHSDLYLRLEKELSYVMWGDYRTELSATELTGYNRTLTGAKVNVDEGPWHLRGFLSHTDQTLLVDQIPGAGTSGYYYLRGTPLIENSETVTLETRNRLLPSQVLSSRKLSRFTDYDVDYFLGTVLFRAPVPSQDDRFNPVYVVVRYETFNAPRKLDVYGGRIAYDLDNNVTIGFTDVVEEQMLGSRRLSGFDLRVSAWNVLELKVETAGTQDPAAADGAAEKVDLKLKVADNANLTGVYRRVESQFDNPSMTGQFRMDNLNASAFGMDAMRRQHQVFGSTSWGLRLEVTPDRNGQLTAEHLMRSEPFNDLRVVADTAEYARKFGWGSASLGFIAAEGPSDRSASPLDSQLLRASIKKSVTDRLSVVGMRQEVVGGTPVREFPNRTAAGLEYSFTDSTRSYLRWEEDQGELLDQHRLVSGVETALDRDTTVYSRYQIDGGNSGDRNSAGMGVRTQRRLNDRLGAMFNLERQQTLAGSSSFGLDDFTATGFGLEYIEKLYKLAGRVELRFGDREDDLMATLGGSYRAWDDVNLFLRGREFIAAPQVGPRRTSLDLLFGTAYRPADDDRLNALAKVRYVQGDSARGFGFGFASDTRTSLVGTLSASYEFTPTLLLSGSFSLQEATDETGLTPFTGITALWAGRLSLDLDPAWSAALRYATLGERASGTEQRSWGVEFDRRLKENIFLGVGYNFEGFDDRVFPDAERTSEGPFVAARFRY
jgi:uncharacterized repeat protein (TIGR01451 family)